MTYSEKDLETILRSVKERRLRREVLEQEDEELRFVENCLRCMPPEDKHFVTEVFVNGISVRRYACETGISRYRAEKESVRLLEVLTRLFNEKFRR